MTSPATLGDVKRYWSTHVNDIEVVDAPVGSPEFLEELERYRYEKMPYLRDIVRSPSWRGKRVLEIGCGPGHGPDPARRRRRPRHRHGSHAPGRSPGAPSPADSPAARQRPRGERRAHAVRRWDVRRGLFARRSPPHRRHAARHRRGAPRPQAWRRSGHHALSPRVLVLAAVEGHQDAGRARGCRCSDRPRLLDGGSPPSVPRLQQGERRHRAVPGEDEEVQRAGRGWASTGSSCRSSTRCRLRSPRAGAGT